MRDERCGTMSSAITSRPRTRQPELPGVNRKESRLRLPTRTPPEWLDAVLGDFDSFLADHAACERKASGTAMGMVSHYPDRPALVRACSELAVEELRHFQQVTELLTRRGLVLKPDRRDPYVRGLGKQRRSGSAEYFLDRLVIASIVESRGCERLALVGAAHPVEPIAVFYKELARSEARHQDLYDSLARQFFPAAEVDRRTAELLDAESRLLETLPLVPALFYAGAGSPDGSAQKEAGEESGS
jgi:tRNA-(ms[2]io[6]A)-hydroxylase